MKNATGCVVSSSLSAIAAAQFQLEKDSSWNLEGTVCRSFLNQRFTINRASPVLAKTTNVDASTALDWA